MRILFDFGHPANVHYFKNLISYLQKENHTIHVLARDKEVTKELLRSYEIPFTNKGAGGHGLFDRIEYTIKSLQIIHEQFRNAPPDLCISHASPYLAVMAATFDIPHIMFNDTEKAVLFKQIVKWCKPDVYVPDSFLLNKEFRLQRLPSFMELAYLHPNLFEPDKNIVEHTGENYVLLRFVSNWATHDIGKRSLSLEFKRKLIQKISRYCRVWISSEKPLPEDLLQYKLPLSANKIHDVIASSKLVVGDSATMSTEAALLGIPSIHIHENRWGYIQELQEKYGLIHHFNNDKQGRESAIKKILTILTSEKITETYRGRRDRMLMEKKNMTDLMVQIVEEKLYSISNS